MKKAFKISLLIILSVCLFTGCKKHNKLVLECKNTIKDSGETIKIKFYKSDLVIRTVTVKKDSLTSEEDIQKISESLKQNYCNNQAGDDYSCGVSQAREEVILKEKGKSNVLMGETKKLTIDKYKNNLEKKDFTCEEKE